MTKARTGRYSQVARVLNLYNILEAHPDGLTIAELHERIRVFYRITRRTLYRDLEAIESAGYPVKASVTAGVARWKLTHAKKSRGDLRQ